MQHLGASHVQNNDDAVLDRVVVDVVQTSLEKGQSWVRIQQDYFGYKIKECLCVSTETVYVVTEIQFSGSYHKQSGLENYYCYSQVSFFAF